MKLLAFAISNGSMLNTFGCMRAQTMRTPIRSRFSSSRSHAVMCSPVDRGQVEKTAHLAQLELSEEEVNKLTPEFQKIINFIDKMSELDLDGVDPMPRPLDAENVVREDTPKMFDNVDGIMDEAPAVERDFIRVPKIGSEGTD